MPYFAKISRQNLFVFVFIEPKSKRKRKKDNKFRGQKVVGYQKSKVALCIQQVLLEVEMESSVIQKLSNNYAIHKIP